MASAGQAQAHSSQPTHFSRPSGHRFSWCRPWKRGAVGRFSSGYWTVTGFLNMWWKVTPNPLTGFSQSVAPTGHLLGVGAVPGRRHDSPVVRQVQRRHRESARGRLLAELLELLLDLRGLGLGAPL